MAKSSEPVAVSWPKVFARIIMGESIRAVAARFGTNPRRVRRALARAGIRAGGVEYGPQGLPALRPYRERLGKVPDAEIAREAGVTPQAIQGQRKRLAVPAFRPAPKAEGTRVAPAPAPIDVAPTAAIAAAAAAPAPVAGAAPATVPSSLRAGVIVRRSADGATSRVAAGPAPSVPAAAAAPRVVPRIEARGMVVFRAGVPAMPEPPVRAPLPPRPRTEREVEIDRLLSAAPRIPEERKRIVRGETPVLPRPAAAAAPAAPATRRPAGPAWRQSDPALLAEWAAKAEAEAAHSAGRLAESRVRDVAPAVVAATPPALEAPRATATPGFPFDGPRWAVHYEGLNEIVYVCADDVVGALHLAAALLPPLGFPVVAIEAA